MLWLQRRAFLQKKNERHSSLEVARAIFPLKNNAFLNFRRRDGRGAALAPDSLRGAALAPGSLDSSPGFRSWILLPSLDSWIPLPDSSPGFLLGFLAWIPFWILSGFLFWIALQIPIRDSSSGFLFWIPLRILVRESALGFLFRIPLLDSSLDSYPGFLSGFLPGIRLLDSSTGLLS